MSLADEDTAVLADDPIGSCTATLTAQHLSEGRVTLTATGGCTGSIESLEIALASVE